LNEVEIQICVFPVAKLITEYSTDEFSLKKNQDKPFSCPLNLLNNPGVFEQAVLIYGVQGVFNFRWW